MFINSKIILYPGALSNTSKSTTKSAKITKSSRVWYDKTLSDYTWINSPGYTDNYDQKSLVGPS